MAGRRQREPVWATWPDEKLLELRLCDLNLRLEGSSLEVGIAQLHRELEQRDIVFRPFFYLSDEWFTPDGVPGIAVPFYLAHPRLAQLELSHMREVEGGTPDWCMRILRHETGHAIDNAYRLRRRRQRQRLFGSSSEPYPEFYTPRPYSRSYVVYLEPWYAQSHPDEDFAETFAVWLHPGSRWRRRYASWPALRKLEYVDQLMRDIRAEKPVVHSRRRVDPLPRLRRTLGEHYAERRRRYGVDFPNAYDRDLLRLFSNAREHRRNLAAVRFVARVRREMRGTVARWTGEYRYTIERVLDDIVERCRELGLRLTRSEEETRLDFAVLLAVHAMNYRRSGRHRVWL